MSDVILKVAVNASNSYGEFILKMNEVGFADRYQLRQVTSPVDEFRDEFVDYIAENGISSLIARTMVMEDITSSSMSADDIELIISKFIDKLGPLKRLLIIDPYFYSASPTSHQLLERLLAPHAAELIEITVIYDNASATNATNMRSAIKAAAPKSTTNEIQSKAFHDRFWINPDCSRGLVMGTSLNGIGKKIALVDRLQDSDVADIVTLAKTAGYAG
ncbi:hypothetical protein TR80_009650 [Xanthomonas campestris]|uniref:hypothetical protein n=1 Tax=Xanthomonas campestris TaxID=339 RepID=UPI0011AEDD82|nr:hypothetical protein [Xanthomonas campestris]TXD43109.1 hypothetical protein TR80_009650 [Xanthomonas campestris]